MYIVHCKKCLPPLPTHMYYEKEKTMSFQSFSYLSHPMCTNCGHCKHKPTARTNKYLKHHVQSNLRQAFMSKKKRFYIRTYLTMRNMWHKNTITSTTTNNKFGFIHNYHHVFE